MNPAEWGTFAIALSACTGGRSASWQPDPETALVCLKLAEVIFSAGLPLQHRLWPTLFHESTPRDL